MTERLLHFIWQFSYYNKESLETCSGESVKVIFPGNYNTNQGPDFSDARIKIGTATWAGTVELHIKTSDWKKHRHTADKNFKNVILHVVWEDDGGVGDIPLLELQQRVPKFLLQRYTELMGSSAFIPCEKNIHTVKSLAWDSWKERLLVERMLRKAGLTNKLLEQNKTNWEETFWWMLARNFGLTVNADVFEAMARSLSLTLLTRHRQQLQQVEALLMGQAGLLEDSFTGDYPVLLQKEYRYLKNKYGLHKTEHPVFFLRMRPGNFPTIRLAQMAVLLNRSTQLFAKIRDSASLKEIKNMFDVIANDYWHYHYRFDDLAHYKIKSLGEAMAGNIIINTVAPLLFAYGLYMNENRFKEKALLWLEQTTAETNAITAGFSNLGISCKHAMDSQAMLELKNEYCSQKRCLECGVGNYLFRCQP